MSADSSQQETQPQMSEAQLLEGEAATIAAGKAFATALVEKTNGTALVFLLGDLGAGKTTFARGFIQGLGHSGAVKSPTYTLLEPYDLPAAKVLHFDLYRVADPVELEFVGIDEIIDNPGIKLIEWPERGAGWLPVPDVTVTLARSSDHPDARTLVIDYR